MRKLGAILLIIVIIASFTTIITNYYIIKILSASRAYINGESQYSKGEKEASKQLIVYVYSEKPEDYELFLKAIEIPIGDRYARESLSNNAKNDNIAKLGFLQAKNHPQDIEDMIWLFKTFKHVGLFENAIGIWREADVMVEQIHRKGLVIHNRFNLHELNESSKNKLTADINLISNKLTIKQRAFSEVLGVICRKINIIVFWLDVFVTVFIMGSIISFVWITLRSIQQSQTKILEQNNKLQALNIDLDKVIYNVSHDLRSPLAALTGLISLINIEDNIEEVKSLALMMQKSVDKQGQFITDLLASIKNNQRKAVHQKCDVKKIIDDVLSLNNYTADGKKLHFIRETSLNWVNCDALKLKTILNNLISNSIKYRDNQKAYSWIKIKTYALNAEWVLEVEDNGIGIEDKNKDKIFDKFFSEKETRDSNGVGLYLTKDAVEQMSGTIVVESELTNGTKVIVKLPNYDS